MTGALWLGIGLHAGYDFMLAAVFNSSGATERDDYAHSLVHVEQSGPELLVGVSSWIQDDLVTIGVVVLVTAAAAVLFARQYGASGWSARLNGDGSLINAEAQNRPEKLDRR